MNDDDTVARAALVDDLIRAGWIRSAAWEDAFRAVPRHVFLPHFFSLTPDRTQYAAIDQKDPDWLALVYGNTVLTTQLDGDDSRWRTAREQGPIQGVATSSSTQPSLMAGMLEALDVRDDHTVLEVGTGTGYNAALLCHRLGDENVTSVEYDPAVAAQARDNLSAVGRRPGIVTGDGADGNSSGAPYDRLIATYSVPSIPRSWLGQVRPGGVIVASLYRDLEVGLVAGLVVDDRGNSHGRLLPEPADFMPSRSRTPIDTEALLKAASTQPPGEVRASALPEPVSDSGDGWTALAGLLMPDVARLDIRRDDGDVQWLLAADGSWAYYRAADHDVEQGGPHALWDRMEAIHRQWYRLGCPARDRLGLSAFADGSQRIWVDDPSDVITA